MSGQQPPYLVPYLVPDGSSRPAFLPPPPHTHARTLSCTSDCAASGCWAYSCWLCVFPDREVMAALATHPADRGWGAVVRHASLQIGDEARPCACAGSCAELCSISWAVRQRGRVGTGAPHRAQAMAGSECLHAGACHLCRACLCGCAVLFDVVRVWHHNASSGLRAACALWLDAVRRKPSRARMPLMERCGCASLCSCMQHAARLRGRWSHSMGWNVVRPALWWMAGAGHV